MSTAEHCLETGGRPVRELTPDDLELERYLLDLTLQPIDRFDGRYQLNYACYALCLAQYNYTPAFTGYLTEAQANTVEKMRSKRVWGYWAHECLVGYQRWDPDPIKFANVIRPWPVSLGRTCSECIFPRKEVRIKRGTVHYRDTVMTLNTFRRQVIAASGSDRYLLS